MDKSELNVLSGIPIIHNKSKKELCFLGKNKINNFDTITIIYTGKLKSFRQLFYFNDSSRKNILSFKDTFSDLTKKITQYILTILRKLEETF
jgi:serine kinase of HPr protein (carbohydrate metabolism regulator)